MSNGTAPSWKMRQRTALPDSSLGSNTSSVGMMQRGPAFHAGLKLGSLCSLSLRAS